MEIIGRISKGSKMDQVYIPKNREGFHSGQYVLITPLEGKKGGKISRRKPIFYNVKDIEPIKLRIIEEIFNLVDGEIESENVIITGSFLEHGFRFNDIDILIISEEKVNRDSLKEKIEKEIGIKTHLLFLTREELIHGLSYEPIYNIMLSKCVSSHRIIFNVKRKINYKTLDLGLLKSKTLIDNFDILNGSEKYYLTFNMVSIYLFVEGKRLSKEGVNKEIEKIFDIEVGELKNNMIDKKKFLVRFRGYYDKTFNLIMESKK